MAWAGLRTEAQFGLVRRESSASCNIILALMGIKLYFSAITMSKVKFGWSFVSDSFICLGPPKPFLREWENSWYSNSLHDLSFKWQKSLLSKAYFSFRKIRLNPELRVFWWVVSCPICCMTVDIKVNVLEKRISQLFKVTFFSKKLEASTDPFLCGENTSNMSLWPPARGSGSSACVQVGGFHGYWSSLCLSQS